MLNVINSFVWGAPTLLLILGVGIYLTVGTGAIQLRWLPKALRHFFRRMIQPAKDDGISPFQALCTALAATVGTGNLAGVAGAIALGGPGAIFWMWICGILGMVTKFAEAALAVRFRVKNSGGEYVGGPMYMIEQGMGKHWRFLAVIYCFFGVVASLGVGNATQINTVVRSATDAMVFFGLRSGIRIQLTMGLALAALTLVLLLGGAKRIGRLAERLVPIASLCYILLCVTVLTVNRENLSWALRAIVEGAYSPSAVTGGMVGSVFLTLRTGVSRGVFTHEAGMGTASIAHGSACVKDPLEQGMMGIVEVFLDTIVICTMTALVILTSGILIPYGADTGISLTSDAFSAVLGDWVRIPLAMFLCCFAFATVLGWGVYGGRCAQYLFGTKAWIPFAVLHGITAVISSLLKTETVWLVAETVNGLMALPNLVALSALSPVLFGLTKKSEGTRPSGRDHAPSSSRIEPSSPL